MMKLYSQIACLMAGFEKQDAGVTAVEYGLIVGAIAVAIISVVLSLGDDIVSLFTDLSDAMDQSGS